MPWVAAAIIGSALIGGLASSAGGQAEAKSADAAANLSNQQYLQTRQDFEPWRQSGIGALGQINALMGLGGGPGGGGGAASPSANYFTQQPIAGQIYSNQSSRGNTPLQDIRQAQAQGIPITDAQWAQAGLPPGGGMQPQPGQPANAFAAPGAPAGDPKAAQENAFASFRTDPGYEFAVGEGQKALERSAAARGILNSGATAKALTRYGQGMADQQYGNWFSRLQSLAGLGQSATGATAAAGQGAAQFGGNALMAAGNARGSAYGGMAQSANQGIQNYLFSNMMGGQGGGGAVWNPNNGLAPWGSSAAGMGY